jgi:hypothetical protein
MTDNLAIFILLIIGIIFFIHRVLNSRGSGFFAGNSAAKNSFHQSKLVGVLLGLNDRAAAELLELYKKEFGKGPARYARRTYQKWKSGKVQPNAQTYDRFLVHLPKVMTYDLKCEVLRHFMEEFASKDNYELTVYTDEWEEKLTPLVEQIINKAFTAQLPAEVERRLRWLGEGDMQAAQKILRASQAEEGRIIVSSLSEEFHHIEKLLSDENLKPRVSHLLEFPYGTIELNIKRR